MSTNDNRNKEVGFWNEPKGSIRDIEDSQEEKRKKAREIKSSLPSEPNTGSSQKQRYSQSSEKTPIRQSGGGNDDFGNNGRGGSRWFFSQNGNQKHLVIILMIIIGLLVFFIFSSRNNSNLPIEKVTSSSTTENIPKLISKPNIELKTLPLEKNQIQTNSISPILPKRMVETLTTFGCSTLEEKNAGFALLEIQEVNRSNVGFKASSGCLWIRFTVPVNTFAGTGYFFDKEDSSSPTGHIGCGTFGMIGRKVDSQEDCRRFLNNNQGTLLRLVIKTEGIVIINDV